MIEPLRGDGDSHRYAARIAAEALYYVRVSWGDRPRNPVYDGGGLFARPAEGESLHYAKFPSYSYESVVLSELQTFAAKVGTAAGLAFKRLPIPKAVHAVAAVETDDGFMVRVCVIWEPIESAFMTYVHCAVKA